MLTRVFARIHVVVDILQDADDLDEALQDISAEFDITLDEAGIVVDQQFKLLLIHRPEALDAI